MPVAWMKALHKGLMVDWQLMVSTILLPDIFYHVCWCTKILADLHLEGVTLKLSLRPSIWLSAMIEWDYHPNTVAFTHLSRNLRHAF